jgi:HK97 family phage prohead protease
VTEEELDALDLTDEDRAVLKAADLDKLDDGDFAYIDKDGDKHLPVNDAAHVRAALARFNQTQFDSPEEKTSAAHKIVAAAKKFGVGVTAASPVGKAAGLKSDVESKSAGMGDGGCCSDCGPTCTGNCCEECLNAMRSAEAPVIPMRRKPRQTRELPHSPEVRFVTPGEVRSGEPTSDGFVPVEGTVIVYDTPYTVRDMFGEFEETIRAGACTQLLADPTLDVRFLFNHGDWPLARTGALADLTLTDTPEGLNVRALLDPRMSAAQDLIVALENRTITQMSVGMQVDGDLWSGEDDRGQPNEREIFRLANIFDVSAVTYPASPTTSLALAQRAWAAVPDESRERVRQMFHLAKEGRKGRITQEESDTLLHFLEDLYTVDTPPDKPWVLSQRGLSFDGEQGPQMIVSFPSFTVSAPGSQQVYVFDDEPVTREVVDQLINDTLLLMAEARNAPTAVDAKVSAAIGDASLAVHHALMEQAKDPDNNSDPVDKKVWKSLSDAHSSLHDAMTHQASDGTPDAPVHEANVGEDGTSNAGGPVGVPDMQDGTGSRSRNIDVDLALERLRRPI